MPPRFAAVGKRLPREIAFWISCAAAMLTALESLCRKDTHLARFARLLSLTSLASASRLLLAHLAHLAARFARLIAWQLARSPGSSLTLFFARSSLASRFARLAARFARLT